jgi:GT2 family glycosyltransferase
MGDNAGFGRAVNRAVGACSCDLLVLLNDDVAPCDHFVERMIEPLHGAAEMTAGVLLRASDPRMIESAGIVVDATFSPYDYLQDELVTVLDTTPPPAPPVGPCGGAAGFSKSVFLDAGGFDENLFAYGEDVDLALRLRKAGARCALATTARAEHLGSATLGYSSLAKANLVGYSRGYLMRKYGVLRRPAAAARVLGVEGAASTVLAYRHRSLSPAIARFRGWRACGVRAALPARELASVSLPDGLRSRYARNARGRT